MSGCQCCQRQKLASSQFKAHSWIAGAVLDGGGGKQNTHSLPTVFSYRNDYKGAISAIEAYRMDWQLPPTLQRRKTHTLSLSLSLPLSPSLPPSPSLPLSSTPRLLH